MNKALFSSEKMDWGTPQALFDQLNAEFNFTLDPASSHENAKCDRHFTEDEDGLSQSWEGGQCSAILRMAERYISGLKKPTPNTRRTATQLFC